MVSTYDVKPGASLSLCWDGKHMYNSKRCDWLKVRHRSAFPQMFQCLESVSKHFSQSVVCRVQCEQFCCFILMMFSCKERITFGWFAVFFPSHLAFTPRSLSWHYFEIERVYTTNCVSVRHYVCPDYFILYIFFLIVFVVQFI